MSKARTVRAYFRHISGRPQLELNPENSFFFAAPWPNDLRLNSDGSLNVKHFPYEKEGAWSKQLNQLALSTRGFSTNGGITLQSASRLDDFKMEHLHGMAYLLDMGAVSDVKIPVSLEVHSGESYERYSLLTFLPQKPLKPNTQYALVVRSILGEYVAEQMFDKSDLLTAFDKQ